MDAVQQAAGSPPQKLAIEKFSDQGVACFKLAGWIDEDFDGKKLAQTIHARTLVLHLADIRRISSFGIREWVDFIAAATKVTNEIILVECAPKVVDQLNMVGNFIGQGRVYSFYVPYRCDYCDTEDRVLMQVDRDWDAIKSMKPPERPCPSCGDIEYFDEDPVTYFSYIVSQGRFELDPAITAALSSRLTHAVSDAGQRLRVDKVIEDRFTYLKLSGDLDASFPRIKLAEGLEGVIVMDLTSLGRVEPAGAAEWRSFIQIISPAAEAIFLLGVPPAFLEKLTSRDDLGPRGQVITIALPYACSSCATTAPHVISVWNHYDVLKFATPPEMKCDDCKAPAYCSASDSLLSHLPTLPKPNVPPEVRKFIKSMKSRKTLERRVSVITPVAESAVVSAGGGRSSWAMVLVASLFAALLTAGGLVGYQLLQKSGDSELGVAGVGKLIESSAPARPAWITSEVVFTGSCSTGSDLGLACIGISSHATSEADARDEAQNAALEAVVHGLGPRITHPAWPRNVGAIFGEMRQARLSLLAEQTDHTSMQYDRAFRTVRDSRRAVTAALRKSAGKAMPATPSGQYWERYEAPRGGYRYLVFIKYDITGDQLDKLIEVYSRPATAGGAQVMTAFPGIAWRYSDVATGAVITEIGDGLLKDMGLAEQYIVLSVQDRVIKDAPSFARIVSDEIGQLRRLGGELKLQVKTGDNLPMEFNRPVTKSGEEATTPDSTPPRNGNGNGGKDSLPGPVNTWDRVGGEERNN